MGAKAEAEGFLRNQKVLRDASRRLLEELCPKPFDKSFTTLLANVEQNNYICMPQKDNEAQGTIKDIEINVDDEDDGYKSEALETSEGVLIKPPMPKALPSRHNETIISNKKSPIKSPKKPRPSSASRVPNHSRESSPFHAKCKPVGPNRRFIALPLPSNLYQSDALETFSKNMQGYFILF